MVRPTIYESRYSEIFCDLVSEYRGPLMELMDTYDEVPSFRTVFRWINESPEFNEMFTSAMNYRHKNPFLVELDMEYISSLNNIRGT